MRSSRLAALSAAAFVAAAGISACSSQASPSPSPSSPSASPTATRSPASPPPSPIVAPIIIDGTKTKVTAKVGDSLDVTIPDTASVFTDNPKVLEVSQPRTEGSARFNGGAKVVGAGKAVLSANHTGGGVFTVEVTATQ